MKKFMTMVLTLAFVVALGVDAHAQKRLNEITKRGVFRGSHSTQMSTWTCTMHT